MQKVHLESEQELELSKLTNGKDKNIWIDTTCFFLEEKSNRIFTEKQLLWNLVIYAEKVKRKLMSWIEKGKAANQKNRLLEL